MKKSAPNNIRYSRLVRTSPIYYGWIILAVGTLGGIMNSPGQTYAFSVFIDHFITDLGLSRSLVSTLYTISTLSASFFLPFVGRQFDIRGARIMITLVSLLLGLACIYMGSVQNAIMLGIGFFLMRQLGQGSLSLISKNVINLWWVRRRGVIMGLSGIASTLMAGLFPYCINTLIPLYGWRITYIILGAILLLIMLPIGWIFIRNKPEDYGLQPDGYTNIAVSNTTTSTTTLENNWDLSQALRTSSFWLLTAGLASMSMLNTGLTFHLFSIFKDNGLASNIAASVFVPIAATGALAQFISGLLIGRIPIRILLTIALIFQVVNLFMAPALNSLYLAYSFGACMGIQLGIEMLVASVVYANYFGRRHLGSIVGFASTLLVASSALGPMPIGIARDLLGNYTSVLYGLAIIPFFLALACIFFCHPPGTPPDTP